MTAFRSFGILFATTLLFGCSEPQGPQSLVGDFAAPGIYALAGDTITVWKRIRREDGAWRFEAYSITPGGTVEYVEELEHDAVPENPEVRRDTEEARRGFALPSQAFEALRAKAALLRPQTLGPDDPVGGYGGEVPPAGCTLDPAKPRVAGVNFLNNANWGSFVLQPGCTSPRAGEATSAVDEMFDRLAKASAQP